MLPTQHSPKDLPEFDSVLRLDKTIWRADSATGVKKKGLPSPHTKEVRPPPLASYVYSVQFYPYTAPGVDPVFAVVQWNRIVVCRPSSGHIDIIAEFYDEDLDYSLTVLAWSQDIDTGEPLLCVSGQNPKIKILNIVTGEFTRTLSGHGREVTDLAISPVNPAIMASCSMDRSIRIWSLEKKHAKNPTCAILHGLHAVIDGLLTIAWHASGRFLASGGHDTIFNLWVTPEVPNDRTGTDFVDEIHYSHFSSTEMHSKYIDCVKFYGDYVFTIEAKFQENDDSSITLWRIDDLDSHNPIPDRALAPVPPPASTVSTTTLFTRSWNGGRFQRLLSLRVPTAPYYGRRFALFARPAMHPVLAIGNLGQPAHLLFWDLQELEEQGDGEANATNTTDLTTPAPSKRASRLTERFRLVKAHKAIALDGFKLPRSTAKHKVSHQSLLAEDFFKFHQADWSPGGEWCVFTSDNGYICATKRWV